MQALRLFAAHIPVLLVVFSLSGCDRLNPTVAAYDLDPALTKQALAPDATVNDLAALISDSETKCNAFIARLAVGENTSNTGFDLATITSSALSTIVTPLAAMHALSASAAISAGSRTAIDSDIYDKASISNFSTAIQTTYYTEMANYTSYLIASESNHTLIVPALEVGRIEQIHAQCTLASAESTINATLQGGAPQNVALQTLDMTATKAVVSGNFAKGDILVISVPGGPSVNVPVDQNPVKDAATAASALITAINANKDFQAANISAATDPNPLIIAPKAGLILNAPTASNIQWSDAGTSPGDQITFNPYEVPAKTTIAQPALVPPGSSIKPAG